MASRFINGVGGGFMFVHTPDDEPGALSSKVVMEVTENADEDNPVYTTITLEGSEMADLASFLVDRLAVGLLRYEYERVDIEGG